MPTTKGQDKAFADHMKPEVETIELDKAIDWIKGRLNPQDVFSDEDLQEWAKENGYFKALKSPLDHYTSEELWDCLLGSHQPGD